MIDLKNIINDDFSDIEGTSVTIEITKINTTMKVYYHIYNSMKAFVLTSDFYKKEYRQYLKDEIIKDLIKLEKDNI